VTAFWQDVLRSAWTELARYPAQSRQFRTRRLSPELALNVYAGLRALDNAPCLLIDAEAPATALFEVGGMRLNAYAGENGPLLGLTLEDPARADLFATVCADAVAAAAGAAAEQSVPEFLARLEAWRRFLRERRAGLTRNEAVGLLGELFILERLVGSDPALLPTWAAPDDGLHDFVRLGHALEIKTSLGPANNLRVSALDQLDPAGLRRLDLVHLRLVEATQGRSLGTVARDIEAMLPDEASRRVFANALLRRGLSPDDLSARSTPVVEVRDMTGYSVTDNFPKLIRSNVPLAVSDAKYLLELRSIAGYAMDAGVIIGAFSEVGAS
jgi:Putative  PD-(D/E)XK family member, (DUF4420)